MLVIVVAIVVCIVACFAFLILRGTPNTPNTSNQPIPSSSEQPAQANPSTESPGVYVDYNEQRVAQTSGTRILFFHAAWCPQCRQLEDDINRNLIPTGVTIFKVDYDSNQKLRQKYGVSLQTTLVLIDDNGNLVKKFVAYDDPSIKALIRNLL